MMATLILLLNRVAAGAPVFVIGVSAVAMMIAPKLRVLRFEGLVLPRRKAGSR